MSNIEKNSLRPELGLGIKRTTFINPKTGKRKSLQKSAHERTQTWKVDSIVSSILKQNDNKEHGLDQRRPSIFENGDKMVTSDGEEDVLEGKRARHTPLPRFAHMEAYVVIPAPKDCALYQSRNGLAENF